MSNYYFLIKNTLLIVLLSNFVLAYGMVLAGADPKWWGDFTVLVTWTSFFLFMFTPFIHPNPNLTTADKYENLCILWMYASGITHLTWELSWCILNGELNAIFGELVNAYGNQPETVAMIYEMIRQQPWTWAWAVYGVADGRYLNSDTFVTPMEWVTVIEGFMNLSTIVMIKQGKRFLALVVILVSTTMELYGTILYYATEIFNDFYFVHTERFIDLIFKFWGMNFLWIIFTVMSIVGVYLKLKAQSKLN